MDAHGGVSRQLDIIISDSAKTPIFYRSGDIRVIPAKCAYTVIEVKAYLDANELDRVFQNMESARNLKKTAYVKPAAVIVYSDNLNQVYLVYIKTAAFASAFRLFNVLNTRGLPLNTSDLLRIENIGEIKENIKAFLREEKFRCIDGVNWREVKQK